MKGTHHDNVTAGNPDSPRDCRRLRRPRKGHRRHQQALARLIREARPKAKAGDIFTDSAREAFRHVIRRALEGPEAEQASATMQQGDPLKAMPLQVNGVYPDTVPYTTVPPTLLAKLPTLPDELAYRIVSRDLILIDVKSDVVVDLVHEILPSNR